MPGPQCPTASDLAHAAVGPLVDAVTITNGGATPDLCKKLFAGEQAVTKLAKAFGACAPSNKTSFNANRFDQTIAPAIDACLSLAAAAQKPKGP